MQNQNWGYQHFFFTKQYFFERAGNEINTMSHLDCCLLGSRPLESYQGEDGGERKELLPQLQGQVIKKVRAEQIETHSLES